MLGVSFFIVRLGGYRRVSVGVINDLWVGVGDIRMKLRLVLCWCRWLNVEMFIEVCMYIG